MATPLKVVVWDSIGNTVLGVRPWTSWEPAVQAQLRAERADAETHAPALRDMLPGIALDLVWFTSATGPLAGFGPLAADFAGSFRPHGTAEAVAAELADADVLILHKERLPAEALAAAPKLRLIQHLGQDDRGVPHAAAAARGIPVCSTPLINYITVAEHGWAQILNRAKRLPSLRTHMASRAYGATWGVFPHLQYLGDLTLGFLGMGEIARPMARVAQAFGMPVIYWDRERFPALEARYGMRFAEWDEVFATSDVLSVQLALNAATEGIIGAREIGLMKSTALFQHSARGKLVDQGALTAALAAGRIGGVALDVFAEEPLPIDDPLLDLHDRGDERVTLTPHCAWQSPWTWVRDSQELWANVDRLVRGEPLRWVVTQAGHE